VAKILCPTGSIPLGEMAMRGFSMFLGAPGNLTNGNGGTQKRINSSLYLCYLILNPEEGYTG
jgi:hypothetical protein